MKSNEKCDSPTCPITIHYDYKVEFKVFRSGSIVWQHIAIHDSSEKSVCNIISLLLRRHSPLIPIHFQFISTGKSGTKRSGALSDRLRRRKLIK